MRVLILGPAHKVWRTEHYIARAFRREGHDVHSCNVTKLSQLFGRRLGGRLVEAFAAAVHPEFVLVTRGRGLEPETIGRVCRGRQAVMWYFDAPTGVPQDVIEKARAVGRLFITNRGQIDFYRDKGIPDVQFLPQACDDEYHTRVAPRPGERFGVSFVGTVGSDEERRRLLEEVGRQTDLHVWGRSNRRLAAGYTVHPSDIHNRRLAEVAASSDAVLGVNSFVSMNAVTAYASNRVWLTLGCGGFYIGHRTPGVEELVPGRYAEYYSGVGELLEKLAYYNAQPERREEIRRAGYEWTHAQHTYRHRVANLLAMKGL